jgi:geranylgeranylglycerol-phosphate geranylgeranyltransferase
MILLEYKIHDLFNEFGILMPLMRYLRSFIELSRPVNVLLSAAAVALGYWVADSRLPWPMPALLCIAAAASVAFGNTINDIIDIRTDRISHPQRPLPSGNISVLLASLFCGICACIAVGTAATVSAQHFVGVAIPIVLLSAYALYLKGTPLIGNFLVSLLVAYPLLFGGLTGPDISRLYIPAFLAFLLNTIREILKDIQDMDGDTAADLHTTAHLAQQSIKQLITSFSLLYVLLVFAPILLHQFGIVYAAISLLIVLPLHAYWTRHLLKNPLRTAAERCSSFIKIEMLAGLIAIAADNALRHYW